MTVTTTLTKRVLEREKRELEDLAIQQSSVERLCMVAGALKVITWLLEDKESPAEFFKSLG